MTLLSLYGSKVAASTVATAGKLSTLAGGTETRARIDVSGEGTDGYIEVYALGASNPPVFGSLPASPSGNGWLYDVTALENQTIASGIWSHSFAFSDAGYGESYPLTSMVVRWWKRASGGTYTAIGSATLSAPSLYTVRTTYSLVSATLSSVSFTTGDKLYIEGFLQGQFSFIGNTIAVYESSSGTLGVSGDCQSTTPGYGASSGASSSHPLGSSYLGPVRMGDLLLGNTGVLRPLANALGITYTTVASQHAANMGLSYTVSAPNRQAMLLYYVISPTAAFAINGDSTIVSPDQVSYPLRPVVARTLLGGPLLQGYHQVVWNYATLQIAEYSQLLGFYNPQNPVVTLTYPDQSGTWQQRRAILRPPTYGTQTTVLVTGVQLTFLLPFTST